MKSLLTPAQYQERVLPELLRRWEAHCFCRNGQFLKLVAFDFEAYGIAPVSLMDTELLIGGIIIGRFERMEDGNEEGADRADRCPQCGEIFLSRYDQYSITMDRQTSRPRNPLPMAETGLYCIGFRHFANAGNELKKIMDYELAGSVEDHIDMITRVA